MATAQTPVKMRLASTSDLYTSEASQLRREFRRLLPHDVADAVLRGEAIDIDVDARTGRKLQALMPRLRRFLEGAK